MLHKWDEVQHRYKKQSCLQTTVNCVSDHQLTALKMKIVAFSALVLMAFAITTTIQQQDSNGAANNQPGHLKDMIVRLHTSQYTCMCALGSTISKAIAYVETIRLACDILKYMPVAVELSFLDNKPEVKQLDSCTTLLYPCAALQMC